MKKHKKLVATLFIFGIVLFPSISNAQVTNSLSPQKVAEMIMLLQQQVILLQKQLAELQKTTEQSLRAVHYASLNVGVSDDNRNKNCFIISLEERDGTPAMNENFSLLVVDMKTTKSTLRQGIDVELKTNEFGKAQYCGTATKITVKSKLLKQDKVFSTEGMLEKANDEKRVVEEQKRADEERKRNNQVLEYELNGLLKEFERCNYQRTLRCVDVTKRIGEIDRQLGTSSIGCFYERIGNTSQIGRTCGG